MCRDAKPPGGKRFGGIRPRSTFHSWDRSLCPASMAASRCRSSWESLPSSAASRASGSPWSIVAVPSPSSGARRRGVGGLRRRAERSGFEGVGVCVFRFAGASTGASWKRRRRKCFAVYHLRRGDSHIRNAEVGSSTLLRSTGTDVNSMSQHRPPLYVGVAFFVAGVSYVRSHPHDTHRLRQDQGRPRSPAHGRDAENPRTARHVARSEGDLSENAEYHGARESQGLLQARIDVLRDKLSRATMHRRLAGAQGRSGVRFDGPREGSRVRRRGGVHPGRRRRGRLRHGQDSHHQPAWRKVWWARRSATGSRSSCRRGR